MGTRKEIRDALEEFLKEPEDGTISNILERYLSRVAVTGITLYPWSKLKPLIVRKMNLVIDDFESQFPMEAQTKKNPNVDSTTIEEMKKRLHSSIELFNGIPFTIQRICELLTDQNISKQYRRIDKFIRGIEKNLNVVTTVDPFGNRIVGDPKSASNGVLSLEDDLPMTPTNCTTVKTPSSWFSSLSSVVNSPDSYPNWKQSQEDRPQDGVISSQDRKSARRDDDVLPPPSKLFRPSEEYQDSIRSETKDENESPSGTSTFTPLLSQLLNGSAPLSEKEQTTPGSCDSTEGSQHSGLLEILTGKANAATEEEKATFEPKRDLQGSKNESLVEDCQDHVTKSDPASQECSDRGPNQPVISEDKEVTSATPHIDEYQIDIKEHVVQKGAGDDKMETDTKSCESNATSDNDDPTSHQAASTEEPLFPF